MPREKNSENTDPARPPTEARDAQRVAAGPGVSVAPAAGAPTDAMAGPAGVVDGFFVGGPVRGPGDDAPVNRIDPTVEDAYWRARYTGEPYYKAERSYDDYRPAYELGWSSRAALHDDFDTVEPTLAQQWEVRRGQSCLQWEQARQAARAAWDRVGSTYFRTGDAGRRTNSKGETPDTVDLVGVLNDLLEKVRDEEFAFQASADEVAAEDLRQLFFHRAEQCHQAADELVQLIWRFGGNPSEGGIASGAMRRGWVHGKPAFTTNSDLSMLEQCERREQAMTARYKKALKRDLPPEVRDFVARESQRAQYSLDQIRNIRSQGRGRPTTRD